MNFVTDCNPDKSALYLVDRGMQGRYYRWFDADNSQWSLCGATMQDALDNREKNSNVGFFPWMGPLTGPKFNPNEKVIEVIDDTIPTSKKEKVKRSKTVKTSKEKMIMQNVNVATTAKPVKAAKVTQTKQPKQTKAAVHPDGTVFFREDRQKWVAMWNGKQEAARPTAEACLKFLKKKYDFDGKVVS